MLGSKLTHEPLNYALGSELTLSPVFQAHVIDAPILVKVEHGTLRYRYKDDAEEDPPPGTTGRGRRRVGSRWRTRGPRGARNMDTSSTPRSTTSVKVRELLSKN